MRRFGHPIGFQHRHAESLLQFLHHRGRQRCMHRGIELSRKQRVDRDFEQQQFRGHCASPSFGEFWCEESWLYRNSSRSHKRTAVKRSAVKTNGNGAHAAIRLGFLTGHPPLNANDFLII